MKINEKINVRVDIDEFTHDNYLPGKSFIRIGVNEN